MARPPATAFTVPALHKAAGDDSVPAVMARPLPTATPVGTAPTVPPFPSRVAAARVPRESVTVPTPPPNRPAPAVMVATPTVPVAFRVPPERDRFAPTAVTVPAFHSLVALTRVERIHLPVSSPLGWMVVTPPSSAAIEVAFQ